MGVLKRQLYGLVKRFCVSLEAYMGVSKRPYMPVSTHSYGDVLTHLHKCVLQRRPLIVAERRLYGDGIPDVDTPFITPEVYKKGTSMYFQYFRSSSRFSHEKEIKIRGI